MNVLLTATAFSSYFGTSCRVYLTTLLRGFLLQLGILHLVHLPQGSKILPIWWPTINRFNS